MKRALVIPPEKWGMKGLIQALTSAGFEVQTAQGGETAIRSVYDVVPHIVIIASDTPQKCQLCSRIGEMPFLPVIALPPIKEPAGVTTMLELGADECMSPPIHRVELVARAHSLLRRYRKPHSERVTMDPKTRKVIVGDRVATLSPVQFRLFSCLVMNEKKTIPYAQLISEVWDKEISVNTLHFHVRRLRRKLGLGTLGYYRLFQSRGEGYCFFRGEG